MLLPLKCLADIILHEILNLMDLEIHFALIAKAVEKQHSMYGNNYPFRSRIQLKEANCGSAGKSVLTFHFWEI